MLKAKTAKKSIRVALACVTCLALCMVTVGAAAPSPNTGGGNDVQICEITPLEDFLRGLDESLYGGVYFDGSGNLCISTVNPEAQREVQTFAMSRNGGLPNIRYTTATYTKADLEKARDVLWAASRQLDIRAIAFRDDQNALAVYVENRTPAKEQAILETAGIKNILFFDYEDGMFDAQPYADATVNSTEPSNDAAAANLTVRGGHMIQKTKGSEYKATLTTTAVYPYNAGPSGWDVGILSVGHEFAEGDTVYYEGQTPIATTTYAQIGDGADFSFSVLNDPSYNPHGYISTPGGSYLIQASSRRRPIVGDTVYMYGQRTGRTSGKVLYTDLIAEIGPEGGTWTVKGLFNYSNRPIEGDSGGPLVVNNGSGWSIVGYNVAKHGKDDHPQGGLGVSISYLEENYDIVPAT